MTQAQKVFELVKKIKPLLAHKESQIQSAALAELLSIWLAGFHVRDDQEATERLRAELLARHCELVKELLNCQCAKRSGEHLKNCERGCE